MKMNKKQLEEENGKLKCRLKNAIKEKEHLKFMLNELEQELEGVRDWYAEKEYKYKKELEYKNELLNHAIMKLGRNQLPNVSVMDK